MNIDLRNVSPEFEKNVNLVKDKKGLKTNVSAVEFMVNQYNSNQLTIDGYKNKVKELEKALDKRVQQVDEIKEAFRILKKYTL